MRRAAESLSNRRIPNAMALFAILTLLAACKPSIEQGDTAQEPCEPTGEIPYDGIDQDCDGADLTDVDADGFDSAAVSGGDDCDDDDASSYPGAAETPYDGIDQDCSGADLSDVDGDGYDSTAVTGGDDCDDEDAEVHPDAEEVCDEEDNDCDDLKDGQDDDVVDASTWYRDEDGDGYGVSSNTRTACQESEGYASADGDCDDGDDAVNPGATEICNDVDDDCDGQIDDISACQVEPYEMSVADADARLLGESAGDRVGWSVAGAGDVNGDGHGDVLIGAPEADCQANGDGVAYLVHGPVTGDFDLGKAAGRFTGQMSGDEVGYELDGVGDINSDGFDDFLVGAGREDGDRGGAYLLQGPVSGHTTLASVAHAHLSGESGGASAGRSVDGAGDNDGDGNLDLLVGSIYLDGFQGSAYLIRGPVTGELSLSDADAILRSEGSYELGSTVRGVGDMNGDGLDDFLVGAKGRGAVYAYYGPTEGEIPTSEAGAEVYHGSWISLGYSSSGAGDSNGDGYSDLLLSGDKLHAAWIYLGPVEGYHELEKGYHAVIESETGDDVFGRSQAPLGDLDHDGFDDVLVSAPHEGTGGDEAGAAYIMYGPFTGTHNAADAIAKFTGEAAGDKLGRFRRAVEDAGDVNGNGQPDIILGAEYNDDSGSSAGCVYVLFDTP